MFRCLYGKAGAFAGSEMAQWHGDFHAAVIERVDTEVDSRGLDIVYVETWNGLGSAHGVERMAPREAEMTGCNGPCIGRRCCAAVNAGGVGARAVGFEKFRGGGEICSRH